MSTRAGVVVSALCKRHGEVRAVDGVTFEARPGEVFGLLGPNGAGKSTTLGCVAGLLAPTAGTVHVEGHDVARDGDAARACIGVVPQELALYEELSARENVAFWGAAWGLGGRALRERTEEILSRLGLQARAAEAVGRFSGGMKRRLNFACGVVHRPSVLLLDEPTVGIDPQSRVRILELVREEAARGTTVLYTTHHMEEAEGLCDRIAVMDHGRIVASGTLEELRARVGEGDLLRLSGTFDVEGTRALLEARPGAEIVSLGPEELALTMRSASASLPSLLAELARAGADVRETIVTRPSLETLFIRLTGRELRE